MQRIALSLIAASLLWSSVSYAQAPPGSLIPPSGVLGTCKFETGEIHFDCIPLYIGYLIQFFLTFAGVFLMFGLMIAGYKYMFGSVTGTGTESGRKEIIGRLVGFSIVLVYLVALTLLLFLIISLIPIIADQIQLMANNLGESIDKFLADPTLVFPFASPEINASLNGMLREFLADFYTGGILQSMQQFGQQFSNAAQGSILFIVD